MKVSYLDLKENLDKLNIPAEYYGDFNVSFEEFTNIDDIKVKNNFVTFVFSKDNEIINQKIFSTDLDNFLVITNRYIDGITNQVVTDNAKYVYHYLRDVVHTTNRDQSYQISDTAIIKSDLSINNNISVGEFSIIEEDVTIGNNVKIGAYVHIKRGTIIKDNVTIDNDVNIGFDAFSFYEINGIKKKVVCLGNVEINDNVSIGSKCIIDRAIDTKTIIGKNTVLDSFCSIEHDTKIGENNVLTCGVRVTGYVSIGDNNYFGANSCIRNQVKIGSNNLFGMGSVIVSDFEDNHKAYGNPAKNKE